LARGWCSRSFVNSWMTQRYKVCALFAVKIHASAKVQCLFARDWKLDGDVEFRTTWSAGWWIEWLTREYLAETLPEPARTRERKRAKGVYVDSVVEFAAKFTEKMRQRASTPGSAAGPASRVAGSAHEGD